MHVWHISCRIFEFLKLAPKTSQYLADRAAVSCCICPMHFCIKVFGFFNKYIFKRMWNSSFLTSITYSLTPSTSYLVNAIATASKLLFTMRSLMFEVVRSLCSYFGPIMQAFNKSWELRPGSLVRRSGSLLEWELSATAKLLILVLECCSRLLLDFWREAAVLAAHGCCCLLLRPFFDNILEPWWRKGSRIFLKKLIVSKCSDEFRHCLHLY